MNVDRWMKILFIRGEVYLRLMKVDAWIFRINIIISLSTPDQLIITEQKWFHLLTGN